MSLNPSLVTAVDLPTVKSDSQIWCFLAGEAGELIAIWPRGSSREVRPGKPPMHVAN